jgi:fructose-1,6-bisphosphatase
MTEASDFTSEELIVYLTRLGKHVNTIYERLDVMNKQLSTQVNAITELQQSFDVIKRETILLLINSLKQLPLVKVEELPTLPTIPQNASHRRREK